MARPPTREADLGEAGRRRQRRSDGRGQSGYSFAPSPATRRVQGAVWTLGLAAEQDGNSEDAADKWRALLAKRRRVRHGSTLCAASWRVTPAAGRYAGPSASERSRLRTDAEASGWRWSAAWWRSCPSAAYQWQRRGRLVCAWCAPMSCSVTGQGKGRRRRRQARARRRPEYVKRIDDLVKDLGLEG